MLLSPPERFWTSRHDPEWIIALCVPERARRTCYMAEDRKMSNELAARTKFRNCPTLGSNQQRLTMRGNGGGKKGVYPAAFSGPTSKPHPQICVVGDRISLARHLMQGNARTLPAGNITCLQIDTQPVETILLSFFEHLSAALLINRSYWTGGWRHTWSVPGGCLNRFFPSTA